MYSLFSRCDGTEVDAKENKKLEGHLESAGLKANSPLLYDTHISNGDQALCGRVSKAALVPSPTSKLENWESEHLSNERHSPSKRGGRGWCVPPLPHAHCRTYVFLKTPTVVRTTTEAVQCCYVSVGMDVRCSHESDSLQCPQKEIAPYFGVNCPHFQTAAWQVTRIEIQKLHSTGMMDKVTCNSSMCVFLLSGGQKSSRTMSCFQC